MNESSLFDRYMRDPVPVRLGNLASSLARLSTTTCDNPDHSSIPAIIIECKYFIEWTGPEAEIEVAAELVRLQVRLAGWQRKWDQIRTDPKQAALVAKEAREASDQVLRWSGLLDR